MQLCPGNQLVGKRLSSPPPQERLSLGQAQRRKRRTRGECQSRGENEMLEPQSILAWIIIGAVAGWLAGLLVKGYGYGLFGNIVIGILGAGVASLLAPRLGLHTETFGGNIVASLLGALVLLLLVGLVRRT